MPRTKVTEDQFTTAPGVITHTPTGARFSYYKNAESPLSHVNFGQAGNVLANGDDFMKEDITRMAENILSRIRQQS